MIDTSEKDFEATVEAHLVDHGGLVRRDPSKYDRTLCLDTEALFEFLFATQPEKWEQLRQQHGEQVKERFLARLVKEIETRKTLDVLRKGVTDLGCKFELAHFRPETSFNEEHRRLYQANILSVMRQVRFSTKTEQSVDLVLFLNGLPIITAELKNPLKGQSVQNAVKQYKLDRDPREPLFAFGRCLAHFAVDTDLAYMTTRLQGGRTDFLPFNRGLNGGAGNPEYPSGFKTGYLWEEVWQRDSLLHIISHFLQFVDVLDEDGKKTGEKRLIFPRYHQLDSVRRLVANARAMGTGQNYLIQHSAGSGKSNSIAWLAHQLAGLHDEKDQRVFDSIIVVTDRRVLDRQLQQTVRSFEQVRGVVTAIEKQKSKELAQALEQGKDIIITTLQTFPFVASKIGKMPGQRFAVIIDEAHSSQSGETTRSMKEVLTAQSLEEAEEEDKPEGKDPEDEIDAAVEEMMRQRGRLPNVSLFAFTATPKAKTLELFGTPTETGGRKPFSLYTMRQAIEEKFILDVLKSYTTHKVYFALLKRIETDPQYDRPTAVRLLRSYADLHEHAIATKTELMVEHFQSQVKDRIGNQAKAMVVTRSRLHAVRYKLAFDKYLKKMKYPHRALVAFSGEVVDPDTGERFTEARMNGKPESQTAGEFKRAENRFLIVAEKFQTGFDQPLLHTMYVDKKLTGLNAVQTLSRLNRTHPHKDDTFVLDFANDADEIQKAFQPYYEATILSETTDPNKLYDLKRMVEEFHLFTAAEVEEFGRIFFRPKAKQEHFLPLLNAVVERYVERGEDEQMAFRKLVNDFVRLYAFLSQVIAFKDKSLEFFYQFTRHLLRKLPVTREELPVEITDNINMDSYRIQETSSGEIKLLAEDGELQPISGLGTGRAKEEDKAPLSEIIAYINENYGTEFTDEDKVRHFSADMERRLEEKEGLRLALDPAVNPSVDTRRLAFNTFFGETLEDMIDANFDIYKKIVEDERFGSIFRAMMFQRIAKSVGRAAD